MGTRAARPSPRRPELDFDVQRHEDLSIAARTIGSTDEDRLAWLVRFATEDAATWQSADRAARGNCLAVLATHFLPAEVSPLPASIDPTVVNALHDELRDILQRLVTAAPYVEPVSWPTDGVMPALVRQTAVGERPAIFAAASSGHRDPRTAVLEVARDLILRAGSRLLACLAADCRRPFYAVRKQRYCSAACNQRVRNAKKPQRPRKRG